jgi:hypothetical protein
MTTGNGDGVVAFIDTGTDSIGLKCVGPGSFREGLPFALPREQMDRMTLNIKTPE